MIEYKNIEWYNYQGGLLPRVAPHKEINLTKCEAQELLSLSKSYFIRYTNEWDRGSGEFWYVIKDKFGGMEELNTKHRTQVRKGLKNCIVKKVDKEEIAKKGYDAYKNAFGSYNTHLIPVCKKKFQQSILRSNYDNWAVFSKQSGTMIAYTQNKIRDNACISETTKFDPQFLKLRPSEALFFELNKYYLEEHKLLYISNGVRSISHDTNIQNYLLQKFKYRKAYCRLNIYYRKDIKLFVNALFPFRRPIKKIHHKFSNKLTTLLTQEEIRRSYDI